MKNSTIYKVTAQALGALSMVTLMMAACCGGPVVMAALGLATVMLWRTAVRCMDRAEVCARAERKTEYKKAFSCDKL